MKNIIEEIENEIPLDCSYEEDARYNWPKRWKELKQRVESDQHETGDHCNTMGESQVIKNLLSELEDFSDSHEVVFISVKDPAGDIFKMTVNLNGEYKIYQNGALIYQSEQRGYMIQNLVGLAGSHNIYIPERS